MSKSQKSIQLGQSHSTASAQLKKLILFKLIVAAGLDNCFQCGEIIENQGSLSIEHKIPWLHSENPRELFFDLDNIAFSHLSCNISVGRRVHTSPEEKRERRNEYNRTVDRKNRNRRHVEWQRRNPEKHNTNSRAWYERRGREQRKNS